MISGKRNFVVHLAADPPLSSHVRELERYFSDQEFTLVEANSSLHLVANYILLRLTLNSVHLFTSRNTARCFTSLQRLGTRSIISIPEIYLDDRVKARPYFVGVVVVKTQECQVKARKCQGVTRVIRRKYLEEPCRLSPCEIEMLSGAVCFVSQATKHIMAGHYFDEQSRLQLEGIRLTLEALSLVARRIKVIILLRPQETLVDQTREIHWYQAICPDFILIEHDRERVVARALASALLVAVDSTVALDAALYRSAVDKASLFFTTSTLGLTDLSATGGSWFTIQSQQEVIDNIMQCLPEGLKEERGQEGTEA